MGILYGTRSHKDLKDAFDWEAYGPSYRFWSKARQAETLSLTAANRLREILRENDIHMDLAA